MMIQEDRPTSRPIVQPDAFPADPLPTEGGSRMVTEDDTFALPPLLLQYWQMAIRWRLIIIGVVAVCLALGLVITLLTPLRYTAQTQVEISREQKNVTNVQGLESNQQGRDQEFYATQYELLRSTSLAERVVRKLNLDKTDDFFAANGVTGAADPGGTGFPKAPSADLLKRRQKQAAGLLLANIDIEPIRTSRLVNIGYTSRSPELSAKIANAWVQEFIAATMDRQFSSTADARKFLEERLAALREKLEISERSAVAYASNRDIVTLDSVRDTEGRTFMQRTLASANLEALNQALATARADRIAAQSRTTSGTADNADVISNPTIADMRAKRAEFAAQYADLMVRFEPGYPAARAVKSQMDALDAAIVRETGRVAGSRVLTYGEALSREKQLEAQVGELKQELDRQHRDSIQYNIYQRDADTNRQLYDALLQRYKEIGVAGTVGASNIAIVDEARVPSGPSAPNLKVNLALALLIGLALAAATVFALEQIDEGIRSPEDVRKYLKVPLLGNVPLAAGDPLGDLSDPKSHLSEAYFSVHSTLAFATNHGLPRSLAISSTRASEGKSTTALAISQIIGRTGKRVLLIDGDLRSPSLHKNLGLDNQSGLANALAGENDFAKLILDTNERGLSLMTAGRVPPNPAELLSSTRLSEVLSLLLQQFDHVVIDAPPVLGLADAPLIGHAVEGVLFVIEAEKTTRRAVRSSLQRLFAVGDQVFGVVVTKMDQTRHSYGYGYGYGYGYDYGYGRKAGTEPSDTASSR